MDDDLLFFHDNFNEFYNYINVVFDFNIVFDVFFFKFNLDVNLDVKFDFKFYLNLNLLNNDRITCVRLLEGENQEK